jgi:uncharacterized membrane protein YphA (DoxX/SURF4 family)
MKSRKTHSATNRRQKQKRAIAVSILLLTVALLTAAFMGLPSKTPSSNVTNEPEGLKTLASHYMNIMQNLNSNQTKTTMLLRLDSRFNQTDLFGWEQTKLTFINDPSGFFEDPTQILDSGKGICVQWSEVYVSACLALGYQSRLVAAVDTSTWTYIHVWAEDYYNGTWVHVDPSDKVWNNPTRYQSWDWGRGIGSDVKIYAFETSTFQDVTSSYSPH